MKFKYTALGGNNQKLEGVLEADSLENAQAELHKMNLSIISCSEISEEQFTEESAKKGEAKVEEGITTYYFVAEDAQGKEVNGTIDSKEPFAAFRRLVTEYRFDVTDLYPQGAANTTEASFREQFADWKQLLSDEGVDLTQKRQAFVKDELDEGEKMSEEIVEEIDQFIINTKKILSDHKDRYTESFFAEIERKLNELERIRASNNLKHITKVCNNLYELISHPDAMKVEETPNKEYESIVSRLEGSGFIQNRFKFLEAHTLQKKALRFEKVQKIFSKIQKALNRSKADEIDRAYAEKISKRHAKWISSLTKGLIGKEKGEEGPHITLWDLVKKFFDYVMAPNTILRRARKQELIVSYNEWKVHKAKVRATRKKVKGEPSEATKGVDFSPFFMEVDSFVGWLLFFYITFFFLASFAVEKGVGLPQELILKTFSSPLLINIAILLVIAHLAFTLKIRLFRTNFLGSLFLFFLTFGVYAILMVNF